MLELSSKSIYLSIYLIDLSIYTGALAENTKAALELSSKSIYLSIYLIDLAIYTGALAENTKAALELSSKSILYVSIRRASLYFACLSIVQSCQLYKHI